MFKVKDIVVYPGHGVAVIDEAIESTVGDSHAIFFKLSFKYKSLSILIPSEKLQERGIRLVSERAEIELALAELCKSNDQKSSKEMIASAWSRRQRDYQHKLESGVLIEIARAYRDLRRSAQSKNLSFGEKGLMLMAEDLLLQEILAVTELQKAEALKAIRAPFEAIQPKQDSA